MKSDETFFRLYEIIKDFIKLQKFPKISQIGSEFVAKIGTFLGFVGNPFFQRVSSFLLYAPCVSSVSSDEDLTRKKLRQLRE